MTYSHAPLNTGNAMPDAKVAQWLSVNDVLSRWPAALPSLNAFGIDTCCGGSDSLADAAREAGVAVNTLWNAIVSAAMEAQ